MYRCNIYISRLSYDIRLSATEVHWHIIANLGFKFRSQFIAHCCRRRPAAGPRDVFVYMKDIEIFSSNFSRKCIMSEVGTTNYHIGLKRRHVYCVTADV